MSEWKVEHISPSGIGSMCQYEVVTLVPVDEHFHDVLEIKFKCLKGLFKFGKAYPLNIGSGKPFHIAISDGLRSESHWKTALSVQRNDTPKILSARSGGKRRNLKGDPHRGHPVGETVKRIYNLLKEYPIGLRAIKIAELLDLPYQKVYDSLTNHRLTLFRKDNLLWIAREVKVPNENASQDVSEAPSSESVAG